MKKIYTFIAALITASAAIAQCGYNDSIVMGPNYAKDVFYSYKNGVVGSSSNTNWHLAFSVQRSQFPSNPVSGVTIRVNRLNAQSGFLNLAKLPSSQSANNWRNIDTTGLYQIPSLYDGYENWDSSAFTRGYNLAASQNDFKWGIYTPATYNLTGSHVFVLYDKSAGWYKKIFINSLIFDTLWNVTMSNIDNSDSISFSINKRNYPNRLFVYRDVINNKTIDREAPNTDWDIVFARYAEEVFMGPVSQYTKLTGVLSNKGVEVAKNKGKRCDQVTMYNKTASYVKNINEIGYDWKVFDINTFKYVIPDTLVYFVIAKDPTIQKMTFTYFGGGSNGKIKFNKDMETGVKDLSKNLPLNVYPNPSNSKIYFSILEPIQNVSITTLKGESISLPVSENSVDISQLNNGIYFIQILTQKGIYTQKIIKQ